MRIFPLRTYVAALGGFLIVISGMPSFAATNVQVVGRSAPSAATTATTTLQSATSAVQPTTEPNTETHTTAWNHAAFTLRRLGFGASPSAVNALAAGGDSAIAAWVKRQITPAQIDDSAAQTSILSLGAAGQFTPSNQCGAGQNYYATNIPVLANVQPNCQGYAHWDNAAGIREYEFDAYSAKQVEAKMVLHFLDAFSIGDDKIHNQGLGWAAEMQHYINTLHADALGNYGKILSDVALEPAMLKWLDANNSNGTNPLNPPNQNFARESMQLYGMGPVKLNMDGSVITDATGTPVPAYTDNDVNQLAFAISGYSVNTNGNWFPVNGDVLDWNYTVFYPKMHGQGPFTFLGQTINDNTQTAMQTAMNVIAHNSSTAPFQAKQLLQRLVNENPSPGYISRVAKVWAANLDAPDQLAQVIYAIYSDAEFYNGNFTMVKEPQEFLVNWVRQLGIKNQGISSYPFGGFEGYGATLGQDYLDPASVFSFYRPGNKETLINSVTWLNRVKFAADMARAVSTTGSVTLGSSNLTFNYDQLVQDAGGSTPQAIGGYLCDALITGGSAQMRTFIINYLASGTPTLPGTSTTPLTSQPKSTVVAPVTPAATAITTNNLRGAIYLLLSSPEYEDT